MKSYTDLEQSRKLAEFLPIESADMKWFSWKQESDSPLVPTFGYDKETAEFYKDTKAVYLPCWSLAALLDVFPNSEQKSVDICYGGWKGEEYVSDWFCSYDDYEKNYFETTNSDNPVDACVEMIIKLKENKVL